MTTFCSLTAWQWDEPLLHLGILFKRLIFCNKELKLTTDSQPVINKRDWGPPALSAHLMPTSKFCIWGTLEIMTTPPCSRKKSKYELMIVWSSETEQISGCRVTFLPSDGYNPRICWEPILDLWEPRISLWTSSICQLDFVMFAKIWAKVIFVWWF